MIELSCLIFAACVLLALLKKDGSLIKAKHAANLSSGCADDELVREIIRLRNAETREVQP